jgi:hypothetical protein
MIDETLIKLGPFLAPSLYLMLALAALLAVWLIATGIVQRRPWRVGAAGMPIALYLACVYVAWVVS